MVFTSVGYEAWQDPCGAETRIQRYLNILADPSENKAKTMKSLTTISYAIVQNCVQAASKLLNLSRVRDANTH